VEITVPTPRQHRNGNRAAAQLAKIDLKSTGEQQEGQHAVHDD
jgi:hypothetical protein